MEFHPLLCSLFYLGVMAGRLPLLWFPVWLLPLNLQPPAPVPAPPPIRRIKPSTSPWDVLQDSRRWNSFHFWRLLVMCVSLGLINVREADPLVQFSVANFAGCSVSPLAAPAAPAVAAALPPLPPLPAWYSFEHTRGFSPCCLAIKSRACPPLARRASSRLSPRP